MRFSERKGLKPVKTIIQIDGVDTDLKTRLWNCIDIFVWRREIRSTSLKFEKDLRSLVIQLWRNFFKRPLDTIPDFTLNVYEEVRAWFIDCDWFEVYDFLEFVAANYPRFETDKNEYELFTDFCNDVLRQEVSGYRFVAGKITQITAEEEINEIEEALRETDELVSVNSHLVSSLKHLSDKKSPDYRNSVKESISAVEAMSRLITGNPKATLGDCLKELERKVSIHGALKNGFSSIYGYTSDADGIRHGLLEAPTLTFEDAKFMLVACSAFINYLIAKSGRAKISLKSLK